MLYKLINDLKVCSCFVNVIFKVKLNNILPLVYYNTIIISIIPNISIILNQQWFRKMG